jgi:predicted nucleic acid-binding protein
VALILDTNALSAVADGEASVLELVGGADRVAVPVIVLGEYRFGIAQSRHRVSYEGWLRQWTAVVETLDIDDRSTHSYSTISLELKRKGTPIPTNDLWIAALCRQHSLPLLSRDKHFDSVPGLQRLDW